MSAAHGTGLPITLTLICLACLAVWYAVERSREASASDQADRTCGGDVP